MKKDGTRFTIRFNPVDPRQLFAQNVLELAGRRKATLIADALWEYQARRGENSEAISLPPVTVPAAISKPRNDVSHENSVSPTSESMPDNGKYDKGFDVDSTDVSDFDYEIHEAILEGLAAFDL